MTTWHGWQPTGWWRIMRDGRVWMETSDEAEARAALEPGETLLRLYESRETEWRPVSNETRTLVVVDTYEIKDRGTMRVVDAPEPPYQVGEVVLLDGVEMAILAIEFVATNPPKYVINGQQSLLLREMP